MSEKMVIECPVCDSQRVAIKGSKTLNCFHCGVQDIPIGYWTIIREVPNPKAEKQEEKVGEKR